MNSRKKILLCLLLAFSCGVFDTVGGGTPASQVDLGDVISGLGLEEAVPYIAYLPDILRGYLPFLFFQVICGTEIYSHFCNAGIYYFSRTNRITGWILGRLAVLLLISFAYVIMRLYGATLGTAVFVPAGLNGVWTGRTLAHVLINALFLFASTACVNAISIRRNSMVGFVSVESLCMSAICAFTLYGTITEDYSGEGPYSWILRINPTYYLLESMKYDEWDYVVAILVFACASVLAVIGTCLAARRHEFISNNPELEGI